MGIGKRPLLVAEQFAFQQRFGDRSAIHGDKRPVAAGAEIMNRLAHHFFAGAVFTQDEHGQIGISNAAHG